MPALREIVSAWSTIVAGSGAATVSSLAASLAAGGRTRSLVVLSGPASRPIERFFLISTATVLERPCEKLCRT